MENVRHMCFPIPNLSDIQNRPIGEDFKQACHHRKDEKTYVSDTQMQSGAMRHMSRGFYNLPYKICHKRAF
jgi:hypothetical protein